MSQMPSNEPAVSALPLALDPAMLLIDAKELARRLSIAKATLHKLVATNSAPKPVHLGRRALWRVEEIEEWVRDGCPPMDRWERQKRLALRPPAKPPRRRPVTAGS